MPQPTFEEPFRSARQSACHLEMRDAYGLDEDYREWSAGHRFDPAERWPWCIELVSSSVARGVAVHRARVVSGPLSSYARYEYELTGGHNVKADEDVRWLPRRQASVLALPSTLSTTKLPGSARWSCAAPRATAFTPWTPWTPC